MRLLNFAVDQVHFQCNDMWYTQKDGLAMEASLVVILAILWMKDVGLDVKKEILKFCKPLEDLNGICPEGRKKLRIDRKKL